MAGFLRGGDSAGDESGTLQSNHLVYYSSHTQLLSPQIGLSFTNSLHYFLCVLQVCMDRSELQAEKTFIIV